MAVASLILGIISIVISFFSAFGWVGVIVGIFGIIFGAVNKNEAKAGVAKGGIVCSIIGVVLSAILFIACVACVGGAALLS